jgi:hypothetical protein
LSSTCQPPGGRTETQALRHGEPPFDYLRVAQQSGLIREDLDAAWLFDVLVALITHAAGNTRNDPGARTATLRATVCSVLASPPGP